MAELLLFSAPPESQPALLLFGHDEPDETLASLDASLPLPRLEAQLSTVSEAHLYAALPGPAFSALAVDAATFVKAWADVALPRPAFTAQAVNADLLATAELAVVLPPPTFEAEGRHSSLAVFGASLRSPTFEARGQWDSNVSRPTVCEAASAWRSARRAVALVEDRQQPPVKLRPALEARWSPALPVSANVENIKPRSLRPMRVQVEALRRPTFRPARVRALSSHTEMVRLRRGLQASQRQAEPRRAGWTSDFTDRPRLRSSVIDSMQPALPVRRATEHRHARAIPVRVLRVVRWQEAMVPPSGWGWQPPVTPPGDPCYLPNSHLVFDAVAAVDGNLVFTCDRHPGPATQEPIIVPVRRIYVVHNNFSLVRVSDGQPVLADTFRITLDDESWAWGFSASVPAHMLGLVEPTDNGPVELLATINGTSFHLIAEQVGRTREFRANSVLIRGRSRIAELHDDYAPQLTFGNATVKTAQQLMADVLTLNGVSLGWAVEWELEDWLVPAGVWSHQGSYISALNAIAKAAGGYLLPHSSAKTVKVRHRYPVAPWDWAGVTPDLVLPADVARRDSKSWASRPAYNRVFIAPQNTGLTGYQVTREGTAGDLAAPLIVDPLMTDVAAVRQRARAELGQGGRRIDLDLVVPVLAETGIVLPGTFVDYADDLGHVRGPTRSVSVDCVFPNVWQTLGVETRA